jgi:predicted O-methyltransferase YrrM
MVINGIEGYLIGSDISFLQQKAQQLPQGGSYLEIGSWMGLSATIFVNELKKIGNITAKVYCVDTWRGSEEHQDLDIIKTDALYEKFLGNIRRVGSYDMITPFRGSSLEIAQEWTLPKLDMIFVDGDHTFEGCYEDVIAWYSKLREGGDMFGHDATEGSPVMQAAKKAAIDLGRGITFFEPPIAHYVWQFI